MILDGFQLASWVGCICGILLFRRPWDSDPEFRNWFTAPKIYWLIYNAIMQALLLDSLYHIYHFMTKDKAVTNIEVYVTIGYFSFHLAYNTCLRLWFLRSAVRIYEFFRSITEYFAERSIDRRKVVPAHDKIFLWVMFLLHMTTSLANLIGFGLYNDALGDSAIRKFVGVGPRVYAALGFVPLLVAQFVGSSLILISTKHLIFIFKDHCNEVLKAIARMEQQKFRIEPEGNEMPSSKLSIISLYREIRVQPNAAALKPASPIRASYPGHPLPRPTSNLVEQFDAVVKIFGLYDLITGPIILGLFILNCLSMIHIVDSMIINKTSLTPNVRWLAFIHHALQFYLLEAADQANRTVRTEKMKIRRALVDVKFDDSRRTEQMKHLEFFLEWNWELSAAGYFTVGRSLLSGIVSVTLTYIVILCQFQVALN